MSEIILLIVATGGMASFGRAGGGKPWLRGTLTVVGYSLVPFLVTFFGVVFGTAPKAVKESAQLWFFVWAVACVDVLFLLGRGYAKPDGRWSCAKCPHLNQQYAVICEQSYASKALPCS